MTTVALIPGLISDRRVWQPLADRLDPALVRFYADLRDHSSMTAMAEYVLDATVGPLIAIGHSMGARVAMEMAHLAPARIAGLVLADTGHHPRRESEMAKRRAMIELGHRGMAQLADAWLPGMVHPDRLEDRDLMDDLRNMVLSMDGDIHERQITALLNRPDAGAYVGEITCPILLVTGRQDAWSPVEQHEDIARLAPNARLEIIEDAGHFAPLEKPDAVASVILDWIAGLNTV